MSNKTMPERLAKYAAISTLVCVIGLIGCSTTEPPKARDAADGISEKWIFSVARAESACHANARVIAFYPDKKNSPSDLELGFLEYSNTKGGFVVGGMVCNNAKKVGDRVWSCTVEVGDQAETLTVGRIPSAYCETLRGEHTDNGKKGKDNPIITPEDCKNSFGSRESCICYKIVHVGSDKPPAEECPDGLPAMQMLLPPGNGSGSGGHT